MIIYQIYCEDNSAVYVGSTVEPGRVRWLAHRRDLVNKKHRNAHLQSIVNKYGIESLKFTVLASFADALPEPSLRAIEAGMIRGLRQAGVNLCNIATNTVAPMMGRRHSSKSIQAMCDVQKAIVNRAKALGIVRTTPEDTRQRISEACKGRKISEANKKAASLRMRGLIRSPETRLRMSQVQKELKTHLGKPKPESQRKAMSAARKDKQAVLAKHSSLPAQEFDSITHAAKFLGLNKGNISEAARIPGRVLKGWSFSLISRGSSK